MLSPTPSNLSVHHRNLASRRQRRAMVSGLGEKPRIIGGAFECLTKARPLGSFRRMADTGS